MALATLASRMAKTNGAQQRGATAEKPIGAVVAAQTSTDTTVRAMHAALVRRGVTIRRFTTDSGPTRRADRWRIASSRARIVPGPLRRAERGRVRGPIQRPRGT